ncbi:MAG TPA: Mur ligase family protein [Polyangiaceae bacterium]|nr:Mur ligase family protein [Polyangiaceae bacterium]
MKIHIIAVAGSGMGALAGLLCELGHEVSGSDTAFDPPIGPELEEWGVRCLKGFDARHIDSSIELVIVGNVVRQDNPEALAAIEQGIAYTHIAGALQRFALQGTSPLVVAGTHGKTTTTALTAWLLEAAGRRPGFLIGGIPKNFQNSFRPVPEAKPRLRNAQGPKRGPPFVIEGDEYDTAFFEKTPKFLHYQAEVAIVTGIEHDHVDIYPKFTDYVSAFRRFLSSLPESGLLVANAADPVLVEIAREHCRAEIAWFALEGDALPSGVAPHWLAATAVADARGTSFDVFAGGVAAGRYVTPLSGKHNLRNTLAAIAATVQGYGLRFAEIAPGLAHFASVRRRQELTETRRGVHLYDDFAHHPTAVRETLQALRTRHPQARVFAVFEPRSATACRNTHQQAYTESFDAASEVLLAPLGRVIPEAERLDTAELAQNLRQRDKPADNFENVEAIVDHLAAKAKSGDVIALLSNGAFGGIHDKLVTALQS